MSTATAVIAAAEKELVIRQIAAKHLRGAQASFNQAQIDRLYDRLTDLHIARLEGGE